MNIRQLKIFIKVCELESMSKTAESLYMTQPAVSQTIISLEDELGIKLFDRIGKELNLNYAGEVLLKYARQISNLLVEAQTSIENITNMKKGKLKIGASMTIGTYLLPVMLAKFRAAEEHELELPVIIDNTYSIAKMVAENEIDLALIEGPITNLDLQVEKFYSDQLYLMCSAEHNWADKELITADMIKCADFIMREKGSGTRQIIENNLLKNNIDYRITHVLNNIEAIKKAIAANLGISILPEIAVTAELKSGLIVKKQLANLNFKRDFNLIFHKDKFWSPLFTEFHNFVLAQNNFKDQF
ncbi:LysR family transcriptional regulator [Halanaerobium salsuginis]|uniref:Transcriptional regulator n=1 Tax=Halanaerobium salsuginis TaxID=29563 RepID=A0A1I4JA58_9FIRM|nr:LysR family transcriptional regulator [Halanaerobium salsuginis]SFL63430.1 transcriptional regulator [Halanaerobium salsuginis]